MAATAPGSPRRDSGSRRPYVIPLVFSYPGGETLSFHTGAQEGEVLANIRRDPRVRVQATEMGPLHPGKPYACNSALVYTSVVSFGHVRIVEDDETKTWFFDRLLEKYSDPPAVRTRLPVPRPHRALCNADRDPDREAQRRAAPLIAGRHSHALPGTGSP